jgi:drug/metabolite transporter (DMT)-like permease
MLLAPLFWGGAFGSTKHVLTELPPLTIAAVRFLGAGILMMLWAIWRGEWHWPAVRDSWRGLLGLGIIGFLAITLYSTLACSIRRPLTERWSLSPTQ